MSVHPAGFGRDHIRHSASPSALPRSAMACSSHVSLPSKWRLSRNTEFPLSCNRGGKFRLSVGREVCNATEWREVFASTRQSCLDKLHRPLKPLLTALGIGPAQHIARRDTCVRADCSRPSGCQLGSIPQPVRRLDEAAFSLGPAGVPRIGSGTAERCPLFPSTWIGEKSLPWRDVGPRQAEISSPSATPGAVCPHWHD